MSAPTTTLTDSDEWEFINDDGFVYKRKKRRLDPTSLARPPDPAPDPIAEERERRARKRKALIQLKEKYEREISLWEHLSNSLKTMQENAKSKGEESYGLMGGEERENEGSRSVGSAKKWSKSWMEGLLLQVEAQEEILHGFSHICDVAESLCNVQDEKTKRVYLDLPQWTSSPRDLITSLTED